MALVISDRTRETSTSTGLGNFVLAGAQAGFQTFAAHMAVGDTTWYVITGPGGSWESGVGTLVGANTLERTTPLESSNGDAKVNFAAGTKDVFVTVPGKRVGRFYDDENLPAPTNAEIDAGTNTLRKAWSVLDVWRAIRAYAQPNLGWKPVQVVKITSPVSAIIIPIPAGCQSLRISGLTRISSPGAQMMGQLSMDGGVSYRQGANDYASGQRTTQNQASSGQAGYTSAAAMMLGYPSDGDVLIPATFNIQAEFNADVLAQFVSLSAGSASANNELVGVIRSRPHSVNGGAGIPTHLRLFPSSGQFAVGTQMLVEAF